MRPINTTVPPAPDARTTPERPVLLRIPFSTYCRKTEWGLTQARIAYDTLDVSIPGMRHIRKANPEEGTVPVLRDGDRIIPGSHDILEWADHERDLRAPPLYPDRHADAIHRWEAWADTKLGPLLRRETYRVLHRDVRPWAKSPLHRARLAMIKPGFKLAARHYRATEHDPADREETHAALAQTVAQIRATDTGYLFAGQPTAADHATAAFWEPVVKIGKELGLDRDDGWGEIVHFVRIVKPRETTRVKSRKVRKRDWEDWRAVRKAAERRTEAPEPASA